MTTAAYKWSYVFDEPTRILVVDDDPILREFAFVHLSAPLCQVEIVADGAAALDLLSREEFDIVMADIEMPGMNGFELVQRIRAQERLRGLPVVMVTGREDIVSIDRAYTAGATSFVTKPINWRQLSYQLRCIIRAKKMAAGDGPGEDGTAASAAMSSATRDQLVASLNAIIDTAALIAVDGAQGREAAHARDITGVAESMLHKLVGTAAGSATGTSPDAMQSGTQPPIPYAC
jgi:DNA-binding response OmpR family regulator